MNDIQLKHENNGKFSLVINGAEISVVDYSIKQFRKHNGNLPTELTITILARCETSTFEIVPVSD